MQEKIGRGKSHSGLFEKLCKAVGRIIREGAVFSCTAG